MDTGERRCECVGSPVIMHHGPPEVHECQWCYATWIASDGRVLSQWNEDGDDVLDESTKV